MSNLHVRLVAVAAALCLLTTSVDAQWWRWFRPKKVNCSSVIIRCVPSEYATIQACANAAGAGDTCVVSKGTYAEVVTHATSGAANNTITFVADGAVTLCGMVFSSKNYIRVIGFTMDPSTGGCTPNSTIVAIVGTNTGLEFWNNTFQNTDANAFMADAAERCHACIVIGGAIQGIGNTEVGHIGMSFTGDDGFLGYITFDNICYLGLGPSGHRLRMVNINFSGLCDTPWHADFLYIQGLNQFGFSDNLFESSHSIGTATNEHNKFAHVQPQGTPPVDWNDNIWRLNLSYNMGGAFYSVYSFTVAPGGTLNRFRYYNNTHANCNRGVNQSDTQFDSCGNFQATTGTISASIYNTIFYQGWGDAATANLVRPWTGEATGSTITKDYNLAYATNGTITTFGSPWTDQANELSNVNPLFVNAASDFTLQSGSGARGTGGPLTTANGSGSGSTSLTVATGTGSFFLGSNASNLPQYGGALVPGDVITVGSTTVQVASRSGDVLTLASAISWSNGDPVYFGSSTTIDIGAFPYKAGGYALSATYAIAGGTVTVTPNDPSLVRFVVCYNSRVPYAVDNSSPYTCSVQAGTFSARVYPRYASATRWAVATP